MKPFIKPIIIFYTLALFFAPSAMSGAAKRPSQVCAGHLSAEQRSQELQLIVKADQDDRKDWDSKTPDELKEVAKRDEARRTRVGEIYATGGFSKPADYAAAALVYQHGDKPEHYFQTYLWSKRGVELGDASQKRLMALGIDRYLVSLGHKQLFGSQATLPHGDTCWCIQQVESSYPDQLRVQYAGQSYVKAMDWLKELNAENACPNTECTEVLKPTPRGLVPGFW